MPGYVPFIIVLLALIAAGCVAVLAWHLSSSELHKSLDDDVRNEGQFRKSDE